MTVFQNFSCSENLNALHDCTYVLDFLSLKQESFFGVATEMFFSCLFVFVAKAKGLGIQRKSLGLI